MNGNKVWFSWCDGGGGGIGGAVASGIWIWGKIIKRYFDRLTMLIERENERTNETIRKKINVNPQGGIRLRRCFHHDDECVVPVRIYILIPFN